MISSISLFTLLLIYLIPANENNNYLLGTKQVEYTYTNNKEIIYLLDSNNYIARTTIESDSTSLEDKIKTIIKTLTINDNTNINNGFRSIIPEGTEIINMNIKDKTLTINFTKELLEINKEYEEKMIEAIVYSLTSLEEIDNVIIKVEGKSLTKLPKTGIIIKEKLDKNYGINKEYNLIDTKNIDKYTIYYVSKYNDKEYYVPVTKYINNDKKDKIKIIIDELKSSPIYEENLMSYLNTNTNLINYNLEDKILTLNFDNSIYTNLNENILEEVIYTISLSLEDNYNLDEIIFKVNDKEIYKKSSKTIE